MIAYMSMLTGFGLTVSAIFAAVKGGLQFDILLLLRSVIIFLPFIGLNLIAYCSHIHFDSSQDFYGIRDTYEHYKGVTTYTIISFKSFLGKIPIVDRLRITSVSNCIFGCQELHSSIAKHIFYPFLPLSSQLCYFVRISIMHFIMFTITKRYQVPICIS